MLSKNFLKAHASPRLAFLPGLLLWVTFTCLGTGAVAMEHGSMGAGGKGMDSAKPAADSGFARAKALEISRSVLGKPLGEHYFQDTSGNRVALSSYSSKPLVISMIFTSCYHICPTTTKHLNGVVSKARAVLGEDSFNVITVGFDTINDSPPRMAQFAKQQRVDDPNWQFLSTDQQTIEQLASELGFQYFRSGSGFDHLIQTSVIDPQGRVYQQVYGIDFEAPLLIEPLKRFVFSTSSDQSVFENVSREVRLFCSVYDPTSE
ncbi:MAG: SCO family protein, partial [Pseudomonadales bacterium]